MTKITVQLVKELKAARKQLESRGWEFIFSVMGDVKVEKRYGSCFIKDDKKFYLNVETYKELPE